MTNGNIDVGDGSFEVSNDMALSALICTPPQLEEASSCANILNQRNGNEDNLPIMVSHFGVTRFNEGDLIITWTSASVKIFIGVTKTTVTRNFEGRLL